MTAPFLPEDAQTTPQPSPPQGSNGKGLRWVVALVVAGGIYVLCFGRSPGTPEDIAPRSDYSGLAITFGVLFVLMVALVLWFWRTYAVSANLARRLEASNLAFARGNYSDAVRQLKPLYDDARAGDKPSIGTHFARSLLHVGSFAEAAAVYISLERRGNILHTGVHRTIAAASLAYVYALQGDLPAANKWLDEAWTRLAKVSGGERSHIAGTFHLAKAIVQVREGKAAEAGATLHSAWDDLRGTFTAREFTAVEAVRAFAQS